MANKKRFVLYYNFTPEKDNGKRINSERMMQIYNNSWSMGNCVNVIVLNEPVKEAFGWDYWKDTHSVWISEEFYASIWCSNNNYGDPSYGEEALQDMLQKGFIKEI